MAEKRKKDKEHSHDHGHSHGDGGHDHHHKTPPEDDNLFGEKIVFKIMDNFSHVKESICLTFCFKRNKHREVYMNRSEMIHLKG